MFGWQGGFLIIISSGLTFRAKLCPAHRTFGASLSCCKKAESALAMNQSTDREKSMATAKKSVKRAKKSAIVASRPARKKPAKKILTPARATKPAKKSSTTHLGSRIAKALAPAQNAAERAAKDFTQAAGKSIPAAKKALAEAQKRLAPIQRKVESAASSAAKSAAEQIPSARRAAAEVMHDLAEMLMPSTTPKKK